MKSKKAKEEARKALDISEFDVSRYNGCERMTALAWAKLLTARYSTRMLMLGPENQKNPYAGDPKFGLKTLLNFMTYPVPPLEQVSLWQRELAPMWPKIKYQSVYDAEMYSIWTGRAAIENYLPEAKEACEQAGSLTADEGEPPPLAYRGMHSYLLEKGFQKSRCSIWTEDNPLVAVKLGAPDEVIMEHFAAWLTAKRKEVSNYVSEPFPPFFTDAEFRQWHKNRVLAFIDLEMFSYHLGLTLTDEIIGHRLFPSDVDVAIGDRVRRTVRPLAQKLMNPSVFGALDWQGANEYYWKGHRERAEEAS